MYIRYKFLGIKIVNRKYDRKAQTNGVWLIKMNYKDVQLELKNSIYCILTTESFGFKRDSVWWMKTTDMSIYLFDCVTI